MYLFGLASNIKWAIGSGGFPAVDWVITHYHINYIEFWFAKRAIIGSILYPAFMQLSDGGLRRDINYRRSRFLYILTIYYINKAHFGKSLHQMGDFGELGQASDSFLSRRYPSVVIRHWST